MFDQREVGPGAPSSQGSSAPPPPPGNSTCDVSDDAILRLAAECLQTDLSEREIEVKSDKIKGKISVTNCVFISASSRLHFGV